MVVFTASLMRALAFAQTSQVGSADWPLRHAGGAVEIGYVGQAERAPDEHKAISHSNACTLFRRLAIPRDTVKKTIRPEMQQPAGKEIRKRVEEESSHDSGRITGQS